MLKQVPGHFKAYTFWLMIILALITYSINGQVITTIGVVLLVIGIFLADQATHLAQADHSALPPTLIEREMQVYRWPFVCIGSLIAVFGAWMTLLS